MNNENFVQAESESGRRIFLQKCWQFGISASVGSVLISSCTSTKKPVAKTTAPVMTNSSPETNPCEDLTGVDKVDVEKRKALGYVSLSPMPDKQCESCKLWIPVPEGKECGGCLLFAGPVSPEGNCTYWAPRV